MQLDLIIYAFKPIMVTYVSQKYNGYLHITKDVIKLLVIYVGCIKWNEEFVYNETPKWIRTLVIHVLYEWWVINA